MSKDNSMAEPSPKVAFVFPGAAVEPCGAEAPFYQRHRDLMQPLLSQASDLASVDLEAVLQGGRLAELSERAGQLFTVAYSQGVATVHAHAGIAPVVAAGYSLGIYAALSASGAIAFRDCLTLAASAFDLMKEACGTASFAMGAVVGLTQAETEAMLAGGMYPSVCMTNTNNDTCGVFSGTTGDVDAFFADALGRGALSTKKFGLSIPYHHPGYLRECALKLYNAAEKYSWRDATVPVLSSIDRTPLVAAADLARFVSANIASPVNWQKVVEAVAATGVTTAYECGPGISLCQNGRFVENRLRYVTVKKLLKREGP